MTHCLSSWASKWMCLSKPRSSRPLHPGENWTIDMNAVGTQPGLRRRGLNSKIYSKFKEVMFEARKSIGFRAFGLRLSDLFWISDFGFRISKPVFVTLAFFL